MDSLEINQISKSVESNLVYAKVLLDFDMKYSYHKRKGYVQFELWKQISKKERKGKQTMWPWNSLVAD